MISAIIKTRFALNVHVCGTARFCEGHLVQAHQSVSGCPCAGAFRVRSGTSLRRSLRQYPARSGKSHNGRMMRTGDTNIKIMEAVQAIFTAHASSRPACGPDVRHFYRTCLFPARLRIDCTPFLPQMPPPASPTRQVRAIFTAHAAANAVRFRARTATKCELADWQRL